jgi:hypothetical protein
VKENVYAPDWRSAARRDYTMQVADILAGWLPEGVDGSISTVPGSFKEWITSADDVTVMARNLGVVAAYLAALQEDTGREIHIGLEPEPSGLPARTWCEKSVAATPHRPRKSC